MEGAFVRKYIIKRILLSIVILFFVMFIIYALMRCLPTSYIEQVAREKSMQPGSKSFEEWMEQLNAMYGMDKQIIPGFFSWLGKAVRASSATAGSGPCPSSRSSRSASVSPLPWVPSPWCWS